MAALGCLSPYIALVQNTDPIYYYVKPLFLAYAKFDKVEKYIKVFRFIFLAIWAADIFRFLVWVVIMALLLTRFTVSCLRNIEKIGCRTNSIVKRTIFMSLGLHFYQRFRIVTKLCGGLQEELATYAMVGGGGAVIVCNFTTIKLYNVTPMPEYLLFPMISIICPIFGSNAMKVGAQCYEISRSFKALWMKSLVCPSNNLFRNQFTGSQFAYWRRKCAAVVPTSYYFGFNDYRFGNFNREVLPNFWFALLNYSISAILY